MPLVSRSLSLVLFFLASLSGWSAPAFFFAAQARAAEPALKKDADTWNVRVSNYDAMPSFLITVDKARQKVLIYEAASPLKEQAVYPCTTGQAVGDKLIRGDLKTPEGVYFVTGHITSGLDYKLYGNEAYPLNYPNPVDKLRKKTGGGIWLHGKGVPLDPRDTRGCVSMNNEDIAGLGNKIAVGQPVLMGARVEKYDQPPKDKTESIARLEDLVLAWSAAWAGRTSAFFDFYNQPAYTQTTENFKAFRKNKEYFFARLPWIRSKVSDVHVLEGPGYWVTWFNQNYVAPNLANNGTRRLYWQEDRDGVFRIVGMEWLPNMATPIMAASVDKRVKTVAETENATPELPKDPVVLPVSALLESPGEERAAAPAKQPADERKVETPRRESGADGKGRRDEVPVGDPHDAGLALAGAVKFVEEWRLAWEKGDLEAYAGFYGARARQGDRVGRTEIVSHKVNLWEKAAPRRVRLENIRVSGSGGGYRVTMFQVYTNSLGYTDRGIKTLSLEVEAGAAGRGGLRIVSEDWAMGEK